MQRTQAALAIYDGRIATRAAVSALADCSALLWRLQLLNIELGDRWETLADRWAKQNLALVRPLYSVHAMMAFASAGRDAAALRLVEGLPRIVTNRTSAVIPEDALVSPFCAALLAFVRKDYAVCVEWLMRVDHIAHRCGGSLAQCDLVHLTFTEAALRARKAHLAAHAGGGASRTKSCKRAQPAAAAALADIDALNRMTDGTASTVVLGIRAPNKSSSTMDPRAAPSLPRR